MKIALFLPQKKSHLPGVVGLINQTLSNIRLVNKFL